MGELRMLRGSLQGKLLFPVIFGGVFIILTILFVLAKTQKEIVLNSLFFFSYILLFGLLIM